MQYSMQSSRDHDAVKILVVDDEPDVLDMASFHLADQGYRVITAGNAAAALQALEQNPDVALLFTDVVMPGGIDGFELADRAKQLHPGLRILYTSGFLKDEGVWHGSLLPKPWRLSHLDEAVRRALG
jgi:CheY-like chemotaxis protein